MLFISLLLSFAPLGADGPRAPVRIEIRNRATIRLLDLPDAAAQPAVPESRMRRVVRRHRRQASLSRAAGALDGAAMDPKTPGPYPGKAALPGARAPALISPPAAASFPALDDDGTWTPPDTNGAVGPNHLVAALNSQVRVQDRNGQEIKTVSQAAFWSALGPVEVFDPRVLYDPGSSRWILTAAGPYSGTDSLFIAVSATASPALSWRLHRVMIERPDRFELDFPHTGFNKNWVVVHGDLFTKEIGEFAGTEIFAFDREELYGGSIQSVGVFSQSDLGGTLAPSFTLDPAETTMYLLGVANGNFQGAGFLQIYAITGQPGFETLDIGSLVRVPSTWDSGPRNFAEFLPQANGARKIDAGDDRFATVVFRGGSIWAAHTTFLPAGGNPTRSVIQWYQVSPGGAIIQRGTIQDPTGKRFYAYPSIGVNKSGDVLIGYSRFASTDFAGAYYSFRSGKDPQGTMRGDALLRSGLAVYDTGEPNRWGDYSSTVVDPSNDTSFWTIQEYARPIAPDGSSRWGIWWGRVDPPAAQEVFRRGDANSDGRVDISDPIAVLFDLFGGGPPLPCPDAADADDNASVTLTDAIYALRYLFVAESAPAAPGPDGCGPDPTADLLSLCSYDSRTCNG